MKENQRRKTLNVRNMVLFALFGALMFISAQIDLVMNVHQLALFIAALTVVYRTQALIPLFVYLLLEGLFCGFGIWWLPYLYIFPLLWLSVMALPRHVKESTATVLIAVVCTLHGLFFGLLYSPVQCYVFLRGDWNATLVWVAAGFSADLLHAVGNLLCSLLTVPLVRLLCRLSGKAYPFKKTVKPK